MPGERAAATEPVDVGGTGDLEPGSARVVESDESGFGEDIALFRTQDGNYYALDDECPHEVASLAEGWIEGHEIECPLHSSRFCLENGKVLCLPALRDARTHKVGISQGRVLLFPGTPADGP